MAIEIPYVPNHLPAPEGREAVFTNMHTAAERFFSLKRGEKTALKGVFPAEAINKASGIRRNSRGKIEILVFTGGGFYRTYEAK
jgi:hypothetical protein